MEGSFSTPAPFLPTPGEPTLEQKQWKEGLEAYIEAIGGDDYTDKRKLAILKHCLGAEGRRVLGHLPPTAARHESGDDDVDVYDEAIKQLDKRYTKKINEVVARHKFLGRCQLINESIDVFVNDLRR